MPKSLFTKDDLFKFLREIIKPSFSPEELGGGGEEPPVDESLLKAVRIAQGGRDQRFQPIRPVKTKPVSPLPISQAVKDVITRPLQEALVEKGEPPPPPLEEELKPENIEKGLAIIQRSIKTHQGLLGLGERLISKRARTDQENWIRQYQHVQNVLRRIKNNEFISDDDLSDALETVTGAIEVHTQPGLYGAPSIPILDKMAVKEYSKVSDILKTAQGMGQEALIEQPKAEPIKPSPITTTPGLGDIFKDLGRRAVEVLTRAEATGTAGGATWELLKAGMQEVAPAIEPAIVAGKVGTTGLLNLVRSLQSLAPGGARPQMYRAEGGPPMTAEEAEAQLKATGVTPWLTVPLSEAITWLAMPGGVYLPYDAAQLAKLGARLATAGFKLVAKGAGKYGAEAVTALERLPGAATTELGLAKGIGRKAGKPGAKAAGVAKEPWEVTREQYIRSFYEEQVKLGKVTRAEAEKDLAEVVKEPPIFMESAHKQAVQKALSEGKLVPPEVLKDYPDLAQQVAKAVAPAKAAEAIKPPVEAITPLRGEERLLWQGAREIKQSYQEGSPLTWLSPSKEYASEYGTPIRKPIRLGKVLDIRNDVIKPGEVFEAERPVQEWVNILNRKGVAVEILDSSWAQTEVKFWDLLHGADLDARKATNLAQALEQSTYDSIRVLERSSKNKRFEAYGVLRSRLQPSQVPAAEAIKPAVEAPAEAVAPGVAKEPWQMTSSEYLKAIKEQKPSVISTQADLIYRDLIKLGPDNKPVGHRIVVTKALSEGKSVPPEVLKDYPDLAARAIPKAEAIPKAIPPTAPKPLVEAPGAIPKAGEVPPTRPPVPPPIEPSKTLQEADDFMAGFSKYLQSPESSMDWVKTLDLRKSTLARRFSNYQQRVEQLIKSGGATDEALAQALRETMSGRLPGIETGIAEELTNQAREAMFSRVYHYLADEPAELMSTAEALRNALLGKAIPRIPGIKGGSAYTRLMRIFGDNPEIMKVLEQKTGLRDVIDAKVLQTLKEYPPVEWIEFPPNIPFGQARLGEEPWKLIGVQDLRTPEQIELAFAQLKSAIKLAETPPFAGIRETIETPLIKSAFQDTLIPLHHRNVIVSALKEIGLTVQDIGNLIRANKASLDQSFGRQVTPLIARYPIKYLSAYVKAWAATLKGETAEKAWTSLMKEPIMRFYEERGWDYLRPLKLPPGVSQAKGVEEFGFAIGGERPIQKLTMGIPWVNFSQRGFVTGINDMLTSIMKDKYAALLRYNEKIASGAVKLKPGEVLDIGKELDGFAHFLEDISGRGRLGPLKDLAPAINSFFFSARLNLGRFFAPRHLFNIGKPEVMKEAWTDFALFAGSIVGIELLGEQLGLWEIGKQGWKKTKIRVGNTWVDPWGGYQQIARFAEEMLTGQYTSAKTGRKYDMSRLEIAKRFLLSKAAPLYGLARTVVTGKRYTGEAFEPGSPRQLFDELAMLSVTDVADAFEHSGWLIGAITIPLAISGMSLISARDKLDELAKQKFAGRGMDALSPGEMQRLRNYPEARAIIEEEEKWRGISAEQKIFKRLAELESWEAIPGMELTKEELKSYKQLGEELIKKDVAQLVISLEYRTATVDERDKMLQKISNTAREWARFKTKQQIWASGATEARQKDLEFTLAETDKQLGKLISATSEFTHEKPNIYDLSHELDNSYRALLKGIPAEAIKGMSIPGTVDSWFIKEAAVKASSALPNKNLYQLNADPKEGTTFEDYYEQWQKRQAITDERELADFDKKYPDANLGNMTRREVELLRNYSKLDKKEQAQFLKDHPELTINPYQEWLKTHPKENAQLTIWGQAKLLTQEADTEARRLIKELDIPDSALPDLTLPPELSVKGYIQYQEQGKEFGYNSAEVKLLLAKDDKLREFLEREPIDTPVELLELKVKHRKQFDLMDAYSDRDSPDYLDDKVKDAQGLTARDRAQAKLKADNPQWVDDMRRIEAIEHEADDKTIEAWVEHGKLADEAPGFNAEEKLWLIDHPDVHQWALENKLLTDDGSKWNEPVLRIDVKWRKQDAEYDALPTEGDARKNYLAENEAYRKDRRRREAYQKGLTDQVEDYVAYYELPTKGYRQERFLVENPVFAKALYDAKQMADLPDPAKVPVVQYDDIYDQFSDQFDEIEGNGKPESEWFEPDPIKRAARDNALRFDPTGKYTEFGLAELKRKAYGKLVPDRHIENYVTYYSLLAKGKPPEQKLWYEDDWWMMEHPEFYKEVYLGILGNERKDYRKVPTREVFALYQQFQALPRGRSKADFRAAHPDLDMWLDIKFPPTEPTSKPTPKPTPKGRSAFDLLEEQGLLGAFSGR